MNQIPSLPQRPQPEELIVFTNILKLIVPQASTSGRYAILEETVPPLGGPPPHTHPDEEVFYVLEGEFAFVLNDLTHPFQAQAGSVVHVPSNALHTYKNVGSSVGRLLTILTPGHLENYFRQIGQPLTAETERPDLSLPPDLSQLDVAKAFALAPQHNVQFFLPEVAP